MASKRKYLPAYFLNKAFGRLTIISELPLSNSIRMVEAKCYCGVVKSYVLKSIMRGLATSCGCFQKEIRGAATTTHGLTKHRLYKIYLGMKERCYNENSEAYHNYGGRGIKICKEWMGDFKLFYDWAIDNGYEYTLDLDRYPNNDGNYEPSNCRFATSAAQARNRRTNLHIEFRGETKLAIEWAEQYGISQKLFHKRRKLGWSVERALTTPKITTFLSKNKECQ